MNMYNTAQLLIFGLAASVIPNVLGNCIDLTPFASNPEDLSILTGGGAIPEYAPVFFDIPAQFMTGEARYCLENITIPESVGINDCSDPQECWLAVGRLANKDTDPRSTESCINSEDEIQGCYSCTCSGSSMDSGIATRLEYDGCGLSSDERWGISCGDVTNGRLALGEDGYVPSNFSHVQVPVCPEGFDYCNGCQGGMHPSFTVRPYRRAIWFLLLSCVSNITGCFFYRWASNGSWIWKNNALTIHLKNMIAQKGFQRQLSLVSL